MKKSIFTLITLGATGFLAATAAQQDNNQPQGGDQAAPPAAQAAVPATDQPAPPADANQMPPAQDNATAQTAQTDQTAPPADQAAPPDDGTRTSTVIQATQPLGMDNNTHITSRFLPPEKSGTNSAGGLLMNFRNAPLDEVLNYMSDAAGFTIVLETQVRGNVSVISKKPLSKDEAVDLLNTVLNSNGYAAVRDDRTLTIMTKEAARIGNIPVKVESDPTKIPKNAEIVTQIIPIRFVEARQLVSDLQSFVSPQATVVANEAGNSIVITDTQQNIRHLAEIIKAIDSSAEAETEIKVFKLQYANPNDVASELSTVFPSGNSSTGGTQSPIRFGGGGPGGGLFGRFGGGGGLFGGAGGAGAGGNSSNDRIKKATQVSAVADSRIQAVIVTAPQDMMDEIASMMKEIDVPSDRDQQVAVIHLNNADAQAAAAVLQNMFQGNNSRGSTSSSQQSALQTREQQNNQQNNSSSSGFGGTSGGIGGGRGGGTTRGF